MKDKDKVIPWLPWLLTSLLRFSFSVEIVNELQFSTDLVEGGFSDMGAENQRDAFFHVECQRASFGLVATDLVRSRTNLANYSRWIFGPRKKARLRGASL